MSPFSLSDASFVLAFHIIIFLDLPYVFLVYETEYIDTRTFPFKSGG